MQQTASPLSETLKRESGTGRERFWARVFWSLLAITTVVRLAYALKLPLTGDEAYFWEWARHPAMGYYDHPPMAGWVLWVSRHLFGDTVAAVRLPAVLAGTFFTAVVYRFAGEITGSRTTASLTGILTMGIPVLGVFGVLFATDTPLLAAGTLAGYLFYKALKTGRLAAWAGGGACLAITLASKFLAAPLVAACYLYLALFPKARKHLQTPGPYLALLISLTGFVPVLLWNASHSWSTFAFNFSARHQPPELGLATAIEYVLSQAIALSPVVLVLAIPLFLRIPAKDRKERGNYGSLPAFIASVPFLGFFFISFVTKIGLHWTAVGAPFLTLALGSDLARAGKPKKSFFLCIVSAWAVTGLIFALPLALTLLPADFNHPLRPGKISTSQLKKYTTSPERIGKTVLAAVDSLPEGTGSFLFTRSYALSSLVAFYTPENPEVTVLGGGSAHGRNHLLWFEPSDHLGQNAIFVTYRPLSRETAFIKERFSRFEPAIEAGGPEDSVVSVIKCYGYNGKR